MDGYLTRQRTKLQAARDLVRQAHTALFRANETSSSLMAQKLITDAWSALNKAVVLLPPLTLAERARDLSTECYEVLRGGSLGYVITLEQRCDELLQAVCAAVAGERTPLAAE